jgi:hypothetical protein
MALLVLVLVMADCQELAGDVRLRRSLEQHFDATRNLAIGPTDANCRHDR